jgi:hypothetical protein
MENSNSKKGGWFLLPLPSSGDTLDAHMRPAILSTPFRQAHFRKPASTRHLPSPFVKAA